MTPPELPDDAFEEYDRGETIAAITQALEALGARVSDNSDLVILSARRRPYDALVQGILLDAAARTGVRIG